METQGTIEARASRIQSALDGAFGVRAKTLSKALKRTGRRMPKRLHGEAQLIVAAQRLGGHPKLMRQVDGAALTRAEERVVTWLDGIDRADNRKGLWLGIAGAVAFNILLILAGFVLWMIWAGHV
ncbi:hypothetical protein [uncultured Tateyamaria sp.]|uniref:hypothetical protein n=1 Tax=uncultured Tateyamaria sp. TaxID=455651 RepID=UPI0026249EB4|nr:hypothetical protein [uncultured Tateyamaria sp.]